MRRVAWALGVLILAAMFAVGVNRSSEQNSDPTAADQTAYLTYVDALSQQPGRLVGDRNRMPVYPWILSATTTRGSMAQSFKMGKRLNVLISCIGLVLLGLWARRPLGFAGSAAFVVSAASAIFVFKAPFVQAEPLYYLLFFATSVLMARLLVRPGPLLGAMAGLVAGVTYLTKSSAVPLIALFLLALAWSVGRSVRRREALRSFLGAAAAFVALLAATVAPYAINSWRAYGNPLHNTNTAMYAWTDSWNESSRLPIMNGAFIGRPEDRPSASRYLRTHNAGDIGDRITSGLGTIGHALTHHGIPGLLLLLQFGFAAVAALASPQRVRRAVRRQPVLVAFGATVVSSYVLTIAWWAPQSAGPRFILALYLPASAAALMTIERLGSGVMLHRLGTEQARAAFAVILAAGSLSLVAAAVWFAGTWFGGE